MLDFTVFDEVEVPESYNTDTDRREFRLDKKNTKVVNSFLTYQSFKFSFDFKFYYVSAFFENVKRNFQPLIARVIEECALVHRIWRLATLLAVL